MHKLLIKATEDTPYVEMNIKEKAFCIKGKSLPENAEVFYSNLFEWTRELKRNYKKEEICFDFKLDYFNTSSSKQIVKFLLELQALDKKSNKIKIRWFYFEEDEDMKMSGLRFARLLKLNFNIISYK